MAAWLWAFLLTQAIEIPLYRLSLRDRPLALALFVGAMASVLTHPILWLVFPRLPFGYWTSVAIAETVIVLVEAGWLYLWRARRPLHWALLANAASAGAGLALRAVCDGPVV